MLDILNNFSKKIIGIPFMDSSINKYWKKWSFFQIKENK